MKKKNTKIWITLLWLPFVSLILVALMQIVAQFVFSTVEGGGSASPVILNIISLLVGTFAILGIMLMPLWIIMLVVAYNHNKKLAEQTEQTLESNNTPESSQNN